MFFADRVTFRLVSGTIFGRDVVPEVVREDEDGYLTVREIAGLRLDAQLVTLSACDTGLGRLVGGEGVVGLTHAFLAAGANAVAVADGARETGIGARRSGACCCCAESRSRASGESPWVEHAGAATRESPRPARCGC